MRLAIYLSNDDRHGKRAAGVLGANSHEVCPRSLRKNQGVDYPAVCNHTKREILKALGESTAAHE